MVRKRKKPRQTTVNRDGVKKVSDWIKRNGFRVDVRPGAPDQIDMDSRTISASSRSKDQLFTLLHESGHLLTYKSKQKAERSHLYRPVWGRGTTRALGMDSKNPLFKSRSGRVLAVLCEEIEAWERGYRLGQRLRIRIARDDYVKCAARCAMSYVVWASVISGSTTRAR